jgi:hypothetical protein
MRAVATIALSVASISISSKSDAQHVHGAPRVAEDTSPVTYFQGLFTRKVLFSTGCRTQHEIEVLKPASIMDL